MVKFYELKKVEYDEKGILLTAAMIHCLLCGNEIAGMGGPSCNAICCQCKEQITSRDYHLEKDDW